MSHTVELRLTIERLQSPAARMGARLKAGLSVGLRILSSLAVGHGETAAGFDPICGRCRKGLGATERLTSVMKRGEASCCAELRTDLGAKDELIG
jgi:hypothetical protein